MEAVKPQLNRRAVGVVVSIRYWSYIGIMENQMESTIGYLYIYIYSYELLTIMETTKVENQVEKCNMKVETLAFLGKT